MKHLKNKIFSILVVFGFNSAYLAVADWDTEKEILENYKRENGITSADLRRNAEIADAYIRCDGITNAELNSNRTVAQFIAQCANGIISSDDCQINVESACINGQEVAIATDKVIAYAFKNTGFDVKKGRGFTTSDFTDGGSRMYNPVNLSNGKSTRLCTQVQNYDSTQPPEYSHNLQVGIPIESNSSLLKAQTGIGGLSIHTTVSFVNDPSIGGIRRRVEVELRETYEPNVINVEGKTAPYRAESSTFADAMRILLKENMVRCKKKQNVIDPTTGNAFTGKTNIDESLTNEAKKAYLDGLEDLYGKGNPAGLDIGKSKSALASILGVQDSSPTLTTDPNSEASISKFKSEKAKASR